MLSIETVSFSDLVNHPDWHEFVAEYIAETANPSIPSPGQQSTRYEALEKEGRLRILWAREGDRLWGVAALVVADSGHYPFPLVATDAIYVRKAYRKYGVGLPLIHRMKEEAKRLGAPGLTFQAPPGSMLDRIIPRIGGVHTHNFYWLSA